METLENKIKLIKNQLFSVQSELYILEIPVYFKEIKILQMDGYLEVHCEFSAPFDFKAGYSFTVTENDLNSQSYWDFQSEVIIKTITNSEIVPLREKLEKYHEQLFGFNYE